VPTETSPFKTHYSNHNGTISCPQQPPHPTTTASTFPPEGCADSRGGGDLGIYWTIPVELFFYILYPLIASLCMLAGSRTKTLFLLWIILMFFNHCPHGVGGMSWNLPLPSMWAGYLSMFVAGALAAVISKESPPGSQRRRAAWNAVALASFAAFNFLMGLLSRSRPTQALLWQLEWLFASLFIVMFLSLVRSDGILNRLLSSPPGRRPRQDKLFALPRPHHRFLCRPQPSSPRSSRHADGDPRSVYTLSRLLFPVRTPLRAMEQEDPTVNCVGVHPWVANQTSGPWRQLTWKGLRSWR
jgi:hypothetical protein